MSIPLLLEKAFEDKDWLLINQAYKELTGRELIKAPQPIKKKGRPKKEKRVIIPSQAEVQDLIMEPDIDPLAKFRVPIPKQAVEKDGKRFGRIEEHKAVPNTFKDDKRQELDSYKSFDKKVRNSENSIPVPRREAPSYVKVNCIDCSDLFTVLPSDLKYIEESDTSYYRCDSCWVKKKRS